MKKVILLLVGLCATAAAFAQTTNKNKKNPEAAVKTEAMLPKLTTAADSAAYASGIVLGNNIKRQIASSDLDKNIIKEAALAAMNDQPLVFTAEQASKIEADYKKVQAQKAAEMSKKAGEEFLAKNKTRQGVITTASGLQYEILKSAETPGAMPTATNTVKVHYHGTNVDGSVFDSSVERGKPIEFPLNGVIKGWTEGVQLMHVGDKFKFFIPANLAYGERSPSPKIKPNAALIFEVELLEITK